MKLHELQEARSQAVAEMRSLTDTAERESRDLSEQEEQRFSELKQQVQDYDRKIERAKTVQEFERGAPAVSTSGQRGDGRFEDRARNFSLTRAIQAQLGVRGVDDGFEREMSAETERRAGRAFEGIAVPDQAFEVRAPITTGTEASDLVPEVHRGEMYVDRLRAALLTGRLGATIMDGLVGSVDIPKGNAGVTTEWLAEDDSVSESTPTFTDISLSPKTVAARTSFTRRTLINAVPSVEQILRNELAQAMAREIDYQALVGDGSANTPTGVANAAGISTVTMGGAPTWATILEHIANIQAADADTLGSPAWATEPYAVKKMRSTLKESGDAGAGYIMDSASTLAGFPVGVSSAVPGDGGDPGGTGTASTLISGIWSQLMIAYWSGVDILLNPYEGSAYQKGRVLIRAMRDCDVAVRHGEAFSVTTDLDAS